MKGGKKPIGKIGLTFDPVFKSFMLSNNTTKYKAKLISYITDIPYEDLLNAKYVSEELKVSNKSEKVFKTDIIIEITNNIICLEMNKDYYDGLNIKNTSYLSRIKGEELDKGDNYLNSNRTILINIDNFSKYKGDKYIYKFMFREQDTLEIENDMFIIYHIDLEHLRKYCYNKNEEIVNVLKLFIEENIDSLRGEDYMDSAIDELEKITNDKHIIGLYDAEAVERKVRNTKLLYEKKLVYEEGMKEGIEKGIEKGLEKGIENNRNEIVQNMIKEKMDDSLIIKLTNITEEDLNRIKNNMI